jgi:hypothetical protein
VAADRADCIDEGTEAPAEDPCEDCLERVPDEEGKHPDPEGD